MTTYPSQSGRAGPSFSVPSIIAIIAALVALFVGAGWGLILAVVAIIFGGIGVILALLPQTRGGVVSFVSMILGVIGIIIAIVRFIF